MNSLTPKPCKKCGSTRRGTQAQCLDCALRRTNIRRAEKLRRVVRMTHNTEKPYGGGALER